MKSKRKSSRITRPPILAVIASCLFSPHILHAQFKLLKKNTKPTQVQSSLDDYLQRVHGLDAEPPRTTGSLWLPSAPMTQTASDYKARHMGDLLIIRVVDNFSATANGTGSQQRAFSASSGISAFMGNLQATNRLQNLFSPKSAETLSGKGASTLASTLSLNFAGRVVEALPSYFAAWCGLGTSPRTDRCSLPPSQIWKRRFAARASSPTRFDNRMLSFAHC